MTLESELETKATEYALSLGAMHLKLNVRGRRGWPDHIYVFPGDLTLFVEFKRLGKEPEPIQAYTIAELEARGAHVFWTNNLDDFKRRVNAQLASIRY